VLALAPDPADSDQRDGVKAGSSLGAFDDPPGDFDEAPDDPADDPPLGAGGLSDDPDCEPPEPRDSLLSAFLSLGLVSAEFSSESRSCFDEE